MSKFSLYIRAELRNESGRAVTHEEWERDFEASNVHSDGMWFDVTDAIENAVIEAERTTLHPNR